jgi:hypothetical protein
MLGELGTDLGLGASILYLGMLGELGTDLGLGASILYLGMLGELGTDLGLGASISGTWRKLELFLFWREGEWRVGTGRASSSATGTCSVSPILKGQLPSIFQLSAE